MLTGGGLQRKPRGVLGDFRDRDLVRIFAIQVSGQVLHSEGMRFDLPDHHQETTVCPLRFINPLIYSLMNFAQNLIRLQ